MRFLIFFFAWACFSGSIRSDSISTYEDSYTCSHDDHPFVSVKDPWKRKSLLGCIDQQVITKTSKVSRAPSMLRLKHERSGSMGSVPTWCVLDDAHRTILSILTDAEGEEVVGLRFYCSESASVIDDAIDRDPIVERPMHAIHQLLQEPRITILGEDAPTEIQRGKKGEGEKKDERTFLQKYWMFILLAAYIFLNASKQEARTSSQAANNN